MDHEIIVVKEVPEGITLAYSRDATPLHSIIAILRTLVETIIAAISVLMLSARLMLTICTLNCCQEGASLVISRVVFLDRLRHIGTRSPALNELAQQMWTLNFTSTKIKVTERGRNILKFGEKTPRYDQRLPPTSVVPRGLRSFGRLLAQESAEEAVRYPIKSGTSRREKGNAVWRVLGRRRSAQHFRVASSTLIDDLKRSSNSTRCLRKSVETLWPSGTAVGTGSCDGKSENIRDKTTKMYLEGRIIRISGKEIDEMGT
ncbi:hypothetical protein BKA70DRAFT_1235757 [Coprinopsis sp. MPI-PUGE-AT-0042]|nr:hypothetical protein BKA70DRAFT_1235757 [Coprinopsis sp. MPI-PUGE-AT-0042]